MCVTCTRHAIGACTWQCWFVSRGSYICRVGAYSMTCLCVHIIQYNPPVFSLEFAMHILPSKMHFSAQPDGCPMKDCFWIKCVYMCARVYVCMCVCDIIFYSILDISHVVYAHSTNSMVLSHTNCLCSCHTNTLYCHTVPVGLLC